jgi:hypothetical protein
MEKSRPDQLRPTKSTDIAAGQGQTNDSGYGKDIKGGYRCWQLFMKKQI